MQILYFNDYQKAIDHAFTFTIIDNTLTLKSSSCNTEIGQCACINIEDEKFNVLYRLFYDSCLYQLQDNFDRY